MYESNLTLSLGELFAVRAVIERRRLKDGEKRTLRTLGERVQAEIDQHCAAITASIKAEAHAG